MAANVTFPAIIPAPLLEGYGLAPQNAILRTDMEAGAARQRRISTDMPTDITARWIMTQQQFAVFEAFWKYKLYDGAGWFQMNIKNGKGMNPVDARFTTPYNAQAIGLEGGVGYAVSGKIECRNMPMMTEAELETYLG